MESAREARRRRIVERGSDRLALITGQIRSLPPPSSSQPPIPPLSNDLRTTAASLSEDNAMSHDLSKNEPSDEVMRTMGESGSSVPGSSQVSKISNETETGEVQDTSIVAELPVTSQIQNPPNHESINCPQVITAEMNAEPSISFSSLQSPPRHDNSEEINLQPWFMNHQLFNSKQIESAISASENIRLLSSAIIALFVVLLYHRCLLGGTGVRSILAFRPLWLVLLTDITIVFGFLFASKDDYQEKMDESKRAKPAQVQDWPDVVAKALEMFFLLRKALSAVFMDWSVYVIVLVSAGFFSAGIATETL
ncbi:hypothetical protein QJS04_geneDACA015869 [Acorus gramineus]|uniref:Uncharacterized protein n=1 Tax=Acorus gramineus TaxID=55184 RepID=A0AAV9BN13_ACOGR|nr:hypothetical protein QJS04_geneDACA015869 [Acorus gramineus]